MNVQAEAPRDKPAEQGNPAEEAAVDEAWRDVPEALVPVDEHEVEFEGKVLTMKDTLSVLREACAKCGIGKSGGKAIILKRLGQHLKAQDMREQKVHNEILQGLAGGAAAVWPAARAGCWRTRSFGLSRAADAVVQNVRSANNMNDATQPQHFTLRTMSKSDHLGGFLQLFDLA